jgi:hypothetical protein
MGSVVGSGAWLVEVSKDAFVSAIVKFFLSNCHTLKQLLFILDLENTVQFSQTAITAGVLSCYKVQGTMFFDTLALGCLENNYRTGKNLHARDATLRAKLNHKV